MAWDQSATDFVVEIPGDLRRSKLALAAFIASAALGCGNSGLIHLRPPDGGTGDGGIDGGADAGVDAGSDAGNDAGMTDAGLDAGRDAGADAGIDAGPDAGPDAGADAGVDAGPDAGPGPVAVVTFGNSATRSGVYTDPAITQATLKGIALDGGLRPDPSFAPVVVGKVYAQPLFLERGVQGADALFVVTEQDNVYAFDTDGGATLWSTNLGQPAALSELGCGNIDPLGITSTPVLDLARNQLLVDAVVHVGIDGGLPDAGSPHHTVFALDVASGNVNWSLDIEYAVPGFDTRYQNQRSALLLLGDVVYVPYGGYWGDCGTYNGRVVGLPLAQPPPTAASVVSFATPGIGSAIWAPGGLASDGNSLFICTGNATESAMNWTDVLSEAVIRLPVPSLVFSGNSADYLVPNAWMQLDRNDTDFGSSGVTLFDLADAGSGHLAFAIGKTQTGWLLDRENLGGLNNPDQPLASIGSVATDDAAGGMFAYQTAQGAYVGYNAPCWNSGNTLAVLKVTPGSPPSLSEAFCVSQGVQGADTGGSPIVTNSDGLSDPVVWGLGTNGDQRLYAYDGDLGTLLVRSAAMSNLTHWIAPIVAKGSIYVAGNQTVFAYRFK
jgi:hypothetical protein